MAFARGRTPLFWWRAALALGAAGFSLLLLLQPPPWRVLAEVGGFENLNFTRGVFVWTWLAGACSVAVITALFFLCPWWAAAPAPEGALSPRDATPRWFWPLVLAAIVACGAIAGPTLGHSLWDDENESLTYYSLGRFLREDGSGKIRFKACPWRKTVFGYTTPNNHIFHNVLSRSTNALWSAAAKPGGWKFNHIAIRLPAFLAALAALAALALLLKEFGFPAAGIAAAWFLAVNPWFTEHAAIARGYTLLMLLVLLAVIAWRRALIAGTWRWWICFAAASLLMMWTYLGSFFILAPLNLATALLILRGGPTVAGPVRTQLSRWFCVNALAAAVALPLLLPLVPQMKKYIAKLATTPTLIGPDWLRDVFWFFAGGAPWIRNSAEAFRYHDMQLVTQALGTWALWAIGLVVVGFFFLGLWRFARSGRLAFALAACMVVAPALQFFYARHQQIFIFEWYVIYALPSVALFWGAGLAVFAPWLARVMRLPCFAPLVAGAILALYACLVSPVHSWQLSNPKTPHLQSVLATRSDPGDYRSAENRRTITFSHNHGNPSYAYDPSLLIAHSPADIILLCRQADREGRPLVANIGHMHVMDSRYPRERALLHDRRLFGRVEVFPGADYGWNRYVFFYTPGGVSGVDMAELLDEDEMAWVEANAAKRPETVFTEDKEK
jgi:hypothetical protein